MKQDINPLTLFSHKGRRQKREHFVSSKVGGCGREASNFNKKKTFIKNVV